MRRLPPWIRLPLPPPPAERPGSDTCVRIALFAGFGRPFSSISIYSFPKARHGVKISAPQYIGVAKYLA